MRRLAFIQSGAVVLILSLAGTLGIALPAKAELTGTQVLTRCRQAYDSLKSYSGTTQVVTKSSMGGMNTTYNTKATVQFVRPGKIRVEGTLMTEGRFAFVSDGKKTWQTSILSQGKWDVAPSTEMAIASFTGVSMMAATVIPSTLVHANWGNLLEGLQPSQVTHEKVNGQDAFKVKTKGMLGEVTLWVDAKTFLLVKLHHLMSMNMGGATTPKGQSGKGVMDSTQTFTQIRVNPAIPASVFARPPKA